MDRQTQLLDAIIQQGLLPLYFHSSATVSINVAKALYSAGIRFIEYTNRGKEALANFIQLKKYCNEQLPGIYIGAGTVKEATAAKAFINAGADFIVSPGLSEDVFDAAYAEKILWIPGCLTPTEIMRAEAMGAKLVKLFPGNILGAAYVSSIKDLFPHLLFLPTGGVDTNLENLSAWFGAGVSAVGMGSKLITAEIIAAEDYGKITALTKEVLQTIATIRKEKDI